MASAKQTTAEKVTVEYTKYPGIVTRIIERSDFERMGADLDTQEFSVANGYLKDATDWPAEAIAYFEGDEEFTVKRGGAAEKASENAPDPTDAGEGDVNNLQSGQNG